MIENIHGGRDMRHLDEMVMEKEEKEPPTPLPFKILFIVLATLAIKSCADREINRIVYQPGPVLEREDSGIWKQVSP